MATDSAKPRIEIRQATPEDLPTVTALLSERDGIELNEQAVATMRAELGSEADSASGK